MAKLTEQDILNWNGDESDYMNADQLEFFRERLLQMQQELLNNADATTNHLQDRKPHRIRLTVPRWKRNTRLSCVRVTASASCCSRSSPPCARSRTAHTVSVKIPAEPIGLKRLLARPTASLSVEAQERRERLKKQFAD